MNTHLKEKYPTSKYDPLPDCPRCQGKGERWYESKSLYSRSAWKPCVCIFVQHEHVPLVLDVIETVVQKELGGKEGKA